MAPPRTQSSSRGRPGKPQVAPPRPGNARIARIALVVAGAVGLSFWWTARPAGGPEGSPPSPAAHGGAVEPGARPGAAVEGVAVRYRITPASPAWKRVHLERGPSAQDRGVDLAFLHEPTSASLSVKVFPVANEALTADDVANTFVQEMRDRMPGLDETRREPFPGRAAGGVVVHVRDPKDANRVELMTGVFVQDQIGYTLAGIAPAEAMAQVRPDIEAMLRSFEPPPPEPPQRELPERPLALPAPPEPPAQLDGHDLRKVEPARLFMEARRAVAHGDYQAAAQLQHWAVAGGGHGKYDLSCYHARAGQLDASFHWLERAVAEEGVDPGWAARDPDLETLRNDARWAQVHPYLERAGRYWGQSGIKKTLLVLPKGYRPGKPIPVVMGMHGMGSWPEDFIDESVQRAADALSVAFVSVSGTLPRGPRKFVWSESPARDRARLDEALAEVRDRVTVAPGQVILIGFSQGGQMAAEIAARDPRYYAGAIVMSPGLATGLSLDGVPPSPDLAQRRFVVVVGAGESPGNVQLAERDATRLRALGVEVFHKPYAEQQQHSFSPDFDTALPIWIRYILGTGPTPR
ncbi:hypothetical protein SOCEGT47_084320 [Sorangium cellulosum]|uniref:Phospholipase/carboxylesterase/thioesterase domain-containing protein n=1 Tax=Sorangium cellulosum TaxID=56 RepID=A0A4P2QDG9_SORCE|nr:alpha/beta hydrolase-fold protein [Sorangium cellulosum]AUX27834.1 hypothetical protein SOCEGT47_084320 [Sorangium cellulosum]